MYFKGIYRLFAIHYFFIITFSCADSKDSKSTAKVVEKSEFSDANVYQQEEKGEEHSSMDDLAHTKRAGL